MKQTRTRLWNVMAGVGLMLAAHSAQAGIARTGYRPGGEKDYFERLAELIAAHKPKESGAKGAAATTPKTRKPNEYDAENERYGNADHGH